METIDGNDAKKRADIVDREFVESDGYVQHRNGEVFKVVGRLGGARKPYHPEGWNGQPTVVLEDREGNQVEVHPSNPNFKKLK